MAKSSFFLRTIHILQMTLAENGFPASYVIKFSTPTKREVTKKLRENGKTGAIPPPRQDFYKLDQYNFQSTHRNKTNILTSSKVSCIL